jgi:hypothetical protein
VAIRTKLNCELPFAPRHRKIAPERQEQAAFVEWAMLQKIPRDYLLSIPNEGERTISYAMMLKRNGLRKGVCDLLLAYPAHGRHGLWLELKSRGRSTISPEQRLWINRMNAIGYVAVIAYGWEQAAKYVEDYLAGRIEYAHEV